MSPETKVIGVEPAGAPCMKTAIEKGEVVDLEHIDKFVDGAAVKKAGALTYQVCKEVLDDIIIVPEGAVCTTIIHMYNKSAIVVEPAGALSVAALKFYADKIKGKKVACIVSGSNNDITRMEEIREKSLLYEGLKHYFIVNFPQKSGAILSFIRDIIGPTDDLVHIQYIKKTNKNFGPALIGIEVAAKEDFEALIRRMEANNITFEYINENNKLFEILI
jgi:threonine dehydratase